jgi:hypothetical protein
MSLTAEQVATLLRPIAAHRVLQAQGQSHLPAYDVAAHLTRIFGIGGWDKRILSLNLVAETETNNKWTVTYSCTLALTVRDPQGATVATWEDGACGTGINQPQRGEAHDLALKSAISYALKRCAAFGLGDQFGLSLYAKGSTAPLLKKTLVMPEGMVSDPADLESHIEVPRSLGNDERQDDGSDGDSGVLAAPVARRRAPPRRDDGRPFESEAGGLPTEQKGA